MEKMEVKSFKDLNNKEKVQYIWDYYRMHILIALVAIVFIGSVVKDIATAVDPLLSVIMINSDSTIDASGFDPFFDSQGIEKYNGMVTLINSFSFEENAQSVSYSDYAVLMARITAGEVDLFFGNGPVFDEYASQGIFADVSTFVSKDVLSKYSDCLVYSTADDHVDPYPCAIKLTDNSFLKDTGFYPEGDVYVGVVFNAPHKDLAVSLFNYILE